MLRARHLSLAAFVALVGCGSDPNVPADSGTDASLDAKPTDAKADAPSDGAPKDASGTDGSTPDAGPVDAASDAPVPCNGSTTAQCGVGFYCDAPGCGLGTCKPAPAETSTKTPICGCDGVTYWNATVAQNHGVTPQSAGACQPSKTCGGFANIKCPAGTKCNFKQPNQQGCQISDPTGECWGLPAQCPQIVIGPQQRECGSQKCTEECAVIKSGVTWFSDNTCPQ